MPVNFNRPQTIDKLPEESSIKNSIIPSALFDQIEYMDNPFFQPSHSFVEVLHHLLGCSKSLKSQVQSTLVLAKRYYQEFEYAYKFLWSYDGSHATFNSYRRELERFLQWSWFIQEQSILTLRREHIESYIKFCKKPPSSWIASQQHSRFILTKGCRIPNTHWRPFVNQASKNGTQGFEISQASIRALFSILSSFYSYLTQEQLAEHNPIQSIRQKSKFLKTNTLKAPVRRLSNLQWDYVIETVTLKTQENPQHYERSRFIAIALYTLYLRISEVVHDSRSTPVMGDFRQDQDRQWWLHVTGKGNKDRIITVSDAMLEALKRYRLHLGLTPLPAPGDQHPLIVKLKGQGAITSTRMVRKLMQECFDNAYLRMQQHGLTEEAQALKTATAHWLRHTSISEDVKLRPREHVRDDAGHSSMQTTDRYIDSDLRERHQSGRHKKIIQPL